MNAKNVCQRHLDLNGQNGITSYDINSLVDDDFEVIGSMSDTLHSISLETGSEVPLYDIEIGNHNGTIVENTPNATNVTNEEFTESTPLANDSLNLMSFDNAAQSTDILTPNVTKSSTSNSVLSIHAFNDPISTVDSIRADYQAAQQSAKQENELLRKACEKKNEQISFLLFIEMLRRKLDEEIIQTTHLSAELEETQRVLNECRMKVDEEVAGKIEREEIIKVLQTTVSQIQCSSDSDCLGSNMINEQTLVSALHEKEELIEALKKELKQAEERYEKEHKEVLNLEEIVKILHEYVQNDQQMHAE